MTPPIGEVEKGLFCSETLDEADAETSSCEEDVIVEDEEEDDDEDDASVGRKFRRASPMGRHPNVVGSFASAAPPCAHDSPAGITPGSITSTVAARFFARSTAVPLPPGALRGGAGRTVLGPVLSRLSSMPRAAPLQPRRQQVVPPHLLRPNHPQRIGGRRPAPSFGGLGPPQQEQQRKTPPPNSPSRLSSRPQHPLPAKMPHPQPRPAPKAQDLKLDSPQRRRAIRPYLDSSHAPASQPHPAGAYAPMLRHRLERDLDGTSVVPLPPRVVGGLRDQIERTKQCNCKRSHCLKLYCECFASSIHCSPLCNCIDCVNNAQRPENVCTRSEAIRTTLERNPHAFRPRALAIAGAEAAARSMAGGLSPSTSSGKGMGGGFTEPNSPLLGGTGRGVGGSSKSYPPVTGVDGETSSLHSRNIPGTGGPSPSSLPYHTRLSSTHGCNCRKSHCLKKYCECFHAAVFCRAVHCRCTDCQNREGNAERERLIVKRRQSAEAAAAGAALVYHNSRPGGYGRILGGADLGGHDLSEEFAAGARTRDRSASVGGAVGGIMGAAGQAAAAVAAGAAAGGVDVTLPPSSYALPVQLRDGTRVTGLSFGTAGRQDMMMGGMASAEQDVGVGGGVGLGGSGVRVRDNSALSQGSPLMAVLGKLDTQDAVARKIPAKTAIGQLSRNSGLNGGSKKSRQESSIYYVGKEVETDLERQWKEATEAITATQLAMRSILVDERKKRAGTMDLMSSDTPAPSSPEMETGGRGVVSMSPSLSAPAQGAPGTSQGVRLAALDSPTKRTPGRKRVHVESCGTPAGYPQHRRAVDQNARTILEDIKSDLERVWKVAQAEGKKTARKWDERCWGENMKVDDCWKETTLFKGVEEDAAVEEGEIDRCKTWEENSGTRSIDTVCGDSKDLDDLSQSSSPLFCSESLPESESSKIRNGRAARELAILLAQDGAMLNELAHVIREKALAMGADRVERARESSRTESSGLMMTRSEPYLARNSIDTNSSFS